MFGKHDGSWGRQRLCALDPADEGACTAAARPDTDAVFVHGESGLAANIFAVAGANRVDSCIRPETHQEPILAPAIVGGVRGQAYAVVVIRSRSPSP